MHLLLWEGLVFTFMKLAFILSSTLFAISISYVGRCLAEQPDEMRARQPILKPAALTCTRMVRACFERQTSEREGCFKIISSDYTCKDTQLGDVILSRTAMGAAALTTNSGHALDSTVDLACLQNFDNDLLSVLLEGVPSTPRLIGLQTKLANCRRTAAPNLQP